MCFGLIFRRFRFGFHSVSKRNFCLSRKSGSDGFKAILPAWILKRYKWSVRGPFSFQDGFENQVEARDFLSNILSERDVPRACTCQKLFLGRESSMPTLHVQSLYAKDSCIWWYIWCYVLRSCFAFHRTLDATVGALGLVIHMILRFVSCIHTWCYGLAIVAFFAFHLSPSGLVVHVLRFFLALDHALDAALWGFPLQLVLHVMLSTHFTPRPFQNDATCTVYVKV